MPSKCALTALGMLLASNLSAQWPANGTKYERDVRQRWMNAKESPAFTPWQDAPSLLTVDSSATTGTGTSVFLSFSSPQRADPLIVFVNPQNHVASISGGFRAPVPPDQWLGADKNARNRGRLIPDGVLVIPTSQVWDVIPDVHPARFARGVQWVDTVKWTSAEIGLSQALHGIRTSTLVRDTLVNGITMWLVRDSLRGSYSERIISYERTLYNDITIDRTGQGVLTGWSLIDPANHSLRVRNDTAEFRGTAVLRYPDNREFRTTTTVQQTRRITAWSAHSYDSVVAARRANRAPFSMFSFPTGPIEERLAAGNLTVRDSLLGEFDRSRDVDARRAMLRMLQSRANGYGNTAFADTIRAHRLRAGDTAHVVLEMLDPAQVPLTMERLKLILPFAGDPGLAFAWDVPAGQFYENMEQRAGEYPTATLRGREICSPEACRALADLRNAKTDPRLQRVGRFAAFMQDPRRYLSLVEHDTTLTAAHNLIAGVGATWQASSHPPLPPPGSPWPMWLEWMNGAPDTGRAAQRPLGSPPSLRFSEGHHNAIEFAKLLHGRDLIPEWQAAADHSPTELGRYVFETMLGAMNAWHPGTDSVLTWLASDSKLTRTRGERGAQMVMAAATPVTDTAVITELIDRALAHVVDGELPWPPINVEERPRPVGQLLDNARRPDRGLAGQDSQSIYIQTPVVTDALRRKWGNRVTWITDMKWSVNKSQYPAAVVTIRALQGVGPLVSISVDVFSARNGARSIEAGAGGNGYLLIRTKDGWRIVSNSMWVV